MLIKNNLSGPEFGVICRIFYFSYYSQEKGFTNVKKQKQKQNKTM